MNDGRTDTAGSAPTNPPDLDVVILTYNDGDTLQHAVDSVLLSRGVDLRVWVIDNASDRPAEVAEDLRVTVLRNSENRGVGGGRNQGTALGTAPLVCVLDSDAAVGPEALAGLLRPFDDPSIGMVVPVFTNQLPTESAGQAPTLGVKIQRAIGRRSTYVASPSTDQMPWWDVEFGIGACQLFRRSAFSQVGGMDDTDNFGPEDVEFCLRIRRAGMRIVQVPGVEVNHPPRRAHRRILSRRGRDHAKAVARYYWHQHPMRGPR